MAIVQLNPATNDIAKLITNVNKAYKTQADITLTNFSGTGVPLVQSGSIFANNGTLWEVDANAAINDSGVANGWVYVKYNVSNARFEYNVTSPTWSDTKQGYYVSNDRYFFKMYKVGAADFRYKIKLKLNHDLGYPFDNGVYRNYTAATENTVFDDLRYLTTSSGAYRVLQGFIPNGLDDFNAMYMVGSTRIVFTGGGAGLSCDDGDTDQHTFEVNIEGILL